MNNNLLQIKIKERLNKLASQDYDNIECWQIAEAFNKAQLEWVRRQIIGINQKQAGDESSKNSIDDLQVLLKEYNLKSIKKDLYYETELIPDDYLYFKSLSIKSVTDCCPDRRMTVYLAELADVNNLLVDVLRTPSVEWGETFASMIGNKFRIYTNNKFDIKEPKLIYYKKPVSVSFQNCVSPSTGLSTVNVECEFKDDIVEILIDEAASILAGDMELFNQYQRTKQNSTTNT